MYDKLWCDKYHPKTINEVYGNKDNILKIGEWLNNFKNKIIGTKIGLFISGPPGIGKTSLSHLILKEYNYEIIEYNASDVRSQKAVKENLTKVLSSTNISIMKGNEVKEIAIIMDEVDGMSSGDRGGVSELVSIMNPIKNKKKIKEHFINPIICISNNNTDKKLSELRKNCIEINFQKPEYQDIYDFSMNIINKENINIDIEALQKIIYFSQQDFRRITYLLQDIKNTFEDKKISIKDIENIYSSISSKKIDINLFDATKKILSNFSSIEEILVLYETDRSLVSMMIHENIILNISKKEFKNKNSKLYKLYHYLTLGDIIDKIIYNNQTWYLQDFNGVIKCCYPSYVFNNYFIKMDHLKPILFTSILSKSAIQFSNFKCIISLKNKFKIGKRYLFYVNDFILKNIFIQNTKILSIIKNYNIDIQLIEKMIKLSKIDENNDYKKLFTNKMKTKLKKFID